MPKQKIVIRFVGGPDDGLLADTDSADAILAQAAMTYASALHNREIGHPYYGVALNLTLMLLAGAVSPQQVTVSGLAKWHAYRIAERHESADRLELVLQHDPNFDSRNPDM